MCFTNGDVLVIDIDDEQHVGQTRHILDATQAALELVLFAVEPEDFLLGQAFEAALFGHGFERHESFHGLANRFVVGEHSAQPAIADERHPRALCVGPDRIARGALGADEQHLAAIGDGALDERTGLASHRQALLEVDDVDSVSLAEDERSHLRVPVAGLVTKVHASL